MSEKTERIDLTEFEDMVAAEESLNLEGANGHDMCDMVRTLITELKRCYELIDAAEGNVPYVEQCEECGATDGGEIDGCDYCGIIHYNSKPRGFYHKDSPKRRN